MGKSAAGATGERADEMANNFTELVNDLAYAKTFYPTSKVTQFINGQASKNLPQYL